MIDLAPDHAHRRAALIERLDGATLVLPAAHMSLRNADVEYEFRQDSDFLWLTGFDAPDAVAVLSPNHPEHPFVLFVRPRDPTAEVWQGARLDPEGAVEALGADAAFPLGELDERLPDLLGRSDRLVMALGRDASLEARVWAAGTEAGRKWKQGLVRPTRVDDPSRTLHELRLHKDEVEVAAMTRAAEITVEAHRRAMEFAAPGRMEWQVQAELEGAMRRAGVRRMAYESIVASGPNATCLHYVRSDRRMEAGELLLIDAGAEWAGYAADVTRTFPVSGRFSPAQRDVYEVVLAAQVAAIDTCASGRSRMAPHEVALSAGMVTTVEPGLYFPLDAEGVPSALRGIGVRIEDDVLITDTGPEVLSAGLVKSVDDVEAACAEGSAGASG